MNDMRAAKAAKRTTAKAAVRKKTAAKGRGGKAKVVAVKAFPRKQSGMPTRLPSNAPPTAWKSA